MWRPLMPAEAAPAGAPEAKRRSRVAVAVTADGVWLGYVGGAVCVEPPAASASAAADPAHASVRAPIGCVQLRAPMSGRIVAQHFGVGDACKQGDALVVLEAMKMEYRVLAPAAGRITALEGAAGDAVQLGALIVTLLCDADG